MRPAGCRPFNQRLQIGSPDGTGHIAGLKRGGDHIIASRIHDLNPQRLVGQARTYNELRRRRMEALENQSPVAVRQPALAKDHRKYILAQGRDTLPTSLRQLQCPISFLKYTAERFEIGVM
jgi:hypothetical protein